VGGIHLHDRPGIFGHTLEWVSMLTKKHKKELRIT
jgi:hypothetical protein